MKKLKIILQSKYLYLILLLISFIYILIGTKIMKYQSSFNNETEFLGKILDYKIDGNKVSITFKAKKEKLIGTFYLKTLDEKKYYLANLKYDSLIEVNGIFKDLNNNTIPNTFNYKKYLYNKKIYKVIDIKSIKINNSEINLLNKIKNDILNNILKSNNSSYLKAFILGDKSSIDVEDFNDFKLLGVSHLFAISGMHITLFSSCILFLFNKLKNKNVPIIISLIVLFFYSLLCGFPSSIKRAYILYLLLSLNKIFNLNIKTIYLLYLTITINVFIDPFIIYDIGFLYSISTTFGLIISNKFINKGNYFIRLFKVSLIAYLFSLPITINNNFEINLISPFNNIILVPFVSLILYPFVLLTLIFSFLNPILSFLISILIFINKILININFFNIVIPKLNIFIIIIYYLILLMSVIFKKKYALLLIILLLMVKYVHCLDNNFYVYYLDVNQGDSLAIITPYQKDIILIDTGGKNTYVKESWMKQNNNYHLSNNTILFFKSLGIDKITTFIISHGDFDHMGEAINLVENFKVDKVIFNCGPYNDLESELIKVLDKKKIKYYSCIKELNIDKNRLHFLQTKEYDNENDNSNVIYTELNGYKFMFMGDASMTTEKEIMNKYNLTDIDVLKIGHHGSKTSSRKDFINEINPKYSVISVGKNNRYGHPNKEVLDNLKNSKIYRTDEDGSIMFKIKNNKLKIETCSP